MHGTRRETEVMRPGLEQYADTAARCPADHPRAPAVVVKRIPCDREPAAIAEGQRAVRPNLADSRGAGRNLDVACAAIEPDLPAPIGSDHRVGNPPLTVVSDCDRVHARSDVERLSGTGSNQPAAPVGRLTDRRDRSVGRTRTPEEAQHVGRECLTPERRFLLHALVGRHRAAIADHVSEAARWQYADITPETGAGNRLHRLLLAPPAGTNVRRGL